MANYNINVKDTTFDGGSGVVINKYGRDDETAALLRDLLDAQEKLADTDSRIAESLESLRAAVRDRDSKTAGEIVKKLTTGTAVSVLTGVASKTVLGYLGIG